MILNSVTLKLKLKKIGDWNGHDVDLETGKVSVVVEGPPTPLFLLSRQR